MPCFPASTSVDEAAITTALELWKTEHRTVIRVVSEEVSGGAQSLRREGSEGCSDQEKPVRTARRPKSSAVVTSQAESVEPPKADLSVEVTGPETAPMARPTPADSAALAAEVTVLRRGNDVLKEVMRVLREGKRLFSGGRRRGGARW